MPEATGNELHEAHLPPSKVDDHTDRIIGGRLTGLVFETQVGEVPIVGLMGQGTADVQRIEVTFDITPNSLWTKWFEAQEVRAVQLPEGITTFTCPRCANEVYVLTDQHPPLVCHHHDEREGIRTECKLSQVVAEWVAVDRKPIEDPQPTAEMTNEDRVTDE